MPYFSWRAIDLTGTIRTGFAYGKDVQRVSARLFAHDMALLSSKEVRFGLWRYPLRAQDKADLFFRLHALLERGVFLTDALFLLYRTTKHPLVQAILYQIVDDVEQGMSFHASCAKHPDLFDNFAIQLLKAGESSGSLAHVCKNLSESARQTLELHKKIRAALALPVITFLIFIAVILLVLMVVLPAFLTAFGDGVQLPVSTQLLLAAQQFISDWFAVICCVVLIAIASWYVWLRKLAHVQQLRDRLLVEAYVFGYLYTNYSLCRIMHACGLLLERGVPILPALQTVSSTVTNSCLHERIEKATCDVTHGIPVSQTFFEHALVEQEGMSLLEIGQATGALGPMMVQVARLYEQRVYRLLTIITTLVQPLLMIVLGLLVVWVIAAVYMPMLNLSTHITP